ncbi:Na+/H+ antiporter NhaA [bacterium]|nr:Na+/H+ antiporter NhaA [bacterium]
MSGARPLEQTQARNDSLRAQLTGPVRAFLQTESGSAGLLLAATIVALAWANSPLSEHYFNLWATDISVHVGSHALDMDLHHWINDGLMVVFFFVIGLELRHEISVGDLRQKRRLVIPMLGAVGGLIVPAILYLLISPSGAANNGWGIVIGTDTAFLLGALALVGPRASTQLRVFLLSMTIGDDLIAVAIIGAAYSDSLHVIAILVAVACLLSIALLGRLGAWQNLAYLVAGFVAWLATVKSGLHPSITGMLAGLLVVSHPPRRDALDRAAELFHNFRQAPLPHAGRSVSRGLQRAVPVNERLQEILHPWTSFVIVPLFAFSNAGVDLRGGLLTDSLTSGVMWAVVVGLVVGKPIGVAIAAFIGVRSRLGELPRGLGPGQIVGGGALSGMGFSVSILIANLAFSDPLLRQEAIVGVLLACLLSVITGWLAFKFAALVLREQPAHLPTVLDPPVDPARDHIRGPADAPLTLVEYADFECPFCGSATNVTRELRARFGGRLRYVFRHLPLADVHPNAELAAQAAEAAAAQGKFWEMHALLFQNQDELELEDLIGYAGRLGLDTEAFTRALSDGTYAERIAEDVASAEASGARATPTFFIGDRRHTGPWDAQTLARELESLAGAAPSRAARGLTRPMPGPRP